MDRHHSINYLELPSRDIAKTKSFFGTLFGWSFTDYGPDYVATSDGGMELGFFRAEQNADTQNGSALVVFYSDDLEATLNAVQQAGGTVKRPIFGFPGGRRFHFVDPVGNEFAVWSEKGTDPNEDLGE